jgi:hypothetical protein
MDWQDLPGGMMTQTSRCGGVLSAFALREETFDPRFESERISLSSLTAGMAQAFVGAGM